MKAIHKSMFRTIILIFLFSSALIGQKEDKTVGKDSIRYRLTNLTDAAQAIQASGGSIHLADYTGFESDNQYENDLVNVANEIYDSLGFDVYDMGLWTIMSYTEGGLEQNISRIQEQITSNKYVLYHYNVLADKEVGEIKFMVVDKVNGISADLSFVAEIINAQLSTYLNNDFIFLKRVFIEVQTLQYFINYFKLDNKFVPDSEENGNSRIQYRDSDDDNIKVKTEMPNGYHYLLSLSGIVFDATGATNLIYYDRVKHSEAPPEYGFNSKGMVIAFTKDGHNYTAKGSSSDFTTFMGYGYYDDKKKKTVYFEANPVVGDSVLVWLGLKVSKCQNNSCNYMGFLVNMTSDITTSSGEINYHLRAVHSTFEEIRPKIHKLGYHFLATVDKVVSKKLNWLEIPTTTWYETDKPCISLPDSYWEYLFRTTIQIDHKLYFFRSIITNINIGGQSYEMIVTRGKDGIWYAEIPDMNANYNESFYYYNYLCDQWQPLELDETTKVKCLGVNFEDNIQALVNIMKSPHFWLEAGTIVIAVLIPEEGVLATVLRSADAALAATDGILYWTEGEKTEAVLAFIGAEVISNVIYKIIKKGSKYVIEISYKGFTKLVENARFLGIDELTRRFVSSRVDEVIESISIKNRDRFLKDIEDALNGKYTPSWSGYSPFIRALKNKKNVKYYELLLDAGRRQDLRMDYDAITNLRKLLTNKKLKKYFENISVEKLEKLFAKLNGWGTGDNAYSYAEITHYFNKAVNNLSKNGTTADLEKLANVFLSKKANNQKKGAFLVLQDLANDAKTFVGKEIRLEKSVLNANENWARIDVFCEKCDIPNLKIEYKHGPTSITKGNIQSEFIERDLYNASDLKEVQWRIRDTGLTKDKLKKWMKSSKDSINDFLTDKQKKDFFNYDDALGEVTDLDIENFVDNNFENIFKQWVTN